MVFPDLRDEVMNVSVSFVVVYSSPTVGPLSSMCSVNLSYLTSKVVKLFLLSPRYRVAGVVFKDDDA